MATHAERQAALLLMRSAADDITAAIEGLTVAQLTTRYIATEWTVAQNVHHMPDSHSFMWNNVRLALTEDRPTWKGYSPDAIALLPDAQVADLTDSLILFRSMQNRIIRLYESLSEEQYARVGVGARGERSVDELLQIYAGHARSHVKQISETLIAGQK